MNIPFKLPLNEKVKKHLANILGVDIVEKVSDTLYMHTIPQSKIDAWDSKRRIKDGVEAIKNEIGFHLKKYDRSGFIYYVDESRRVCECYYELSGVKEYDILISTDHLSEWFLPVRQKMSELEKVDIISKMQSWLRESNIRAELW